MKNKSRRAVKAPTPERLKNIALYYLSRYAASEASLRRVLQNRVRRANMAHPDIAADHEKQNVLRLAIEEIVAAHKKTGAVNDKAITEMKVASLRRSGKSQRFIQQKLGAAGLKKDMVAEALDEHDGEGNAEEAEKKAALAFCKKRRIGKFRPEDRRKEGDAKKDFSALARAGFSSGLIRKILDVAPDDAPGEWE